MPAKTALVVCGPTAGGKSGLSDALAEWMTRARGRYVPTLVVDSMQVYRELPVITNQARSRPAELVGIVSVSEEWNVARHRARADAITSQEEITHFVLDAGTGMYLNALLLDFPLAPKVTPELRESARRFTAGDTNERRASRDMELKLAGAGIRGSVWAEDLRHNTIIFYLRPDRARIDAAITERSRRIARDGLQEAALLHAMAETGHHVSPQVRDSVGVREITERLAGTISLAEAEERIAARTRRFARRQIRWFDKLARTLEGRARVFVVPDREHMPDLHTMHDILRI